MSQIATTSPTNPHGQNSLDSSTDKPVDTTSLLCRSEVPLDEARGEASSKPPTKLKNRRRRVDEILRLRQLAHELEADLDSLQAKRPKESALTHWRDRARLELRARRQTEIKNVWLHARLARYKKTAVQLLKSLRMDLTVSSSRGQRPITTDAGSSERPIVSSYVEEAGVPGAVLIQLETTWQFNHASTESVEHALRAVLSTDHVATACFSVNFNVVSSDASSSHATFTIHSNDDLRFEGSQLTRFARNPTAGECEITVMAQVEPSGPSLDSFELLVEEATTYHVCQSTPENATLVTILRQFHCHSTDLERHATRTDMTRAVALFARDEMAWMHRVVQRRLAS